MDGITRRRLLAASAGSLALAGCLERLPGGSGDDDGDLESTLSDDVEAALTPLPRSVDGTTASTVTLLNPERAGDQDVRVLLGDPPDIGVPADAIDRSATALYSEDEDGTFSTGVGTIASIVGGFGAEAVSAPEEYAVDSADGVALAASRENEPWDDGVDAATAVRAGEAESVRAASDLPAVVAPIADAPEIFASPNPTAAEFDDDAAIEAEHVTGIAAGYETSIEDRERTITYVIAFESADLVDVDPLVNSAGESTETEVLDVSREIDGRRARIRMVTALPEDVPDNAPDVHFRITRSYGDSQVELQVLGTERVGVANLELRVDGEAVSGPWPSEGEIREGEEYFIDVPPLSIVGVYWLDPEYDGVRQELGREIVDAGRLFEHEYEPGADRLRLTPSRTVDRPPADFGVAVGPIGEVSDDPTPLSEYVDELSTDSTVVLEDVQYEDRAVVFRRVPDRPEVDPERLQTVRLQPPGLFSLSVRDGEYILRASHSEPEPAVHFRILADGEPTDRQWSDRYEDVEMGDVLTLDLAAGARVTVEWVGDDEPVMVMTDDAPPVADFEFDVGDSAVEITHHSGAELDADQLSVYLGGLPDPDRPDAWANEYDTVTAGDSITVPYSTEGRETRRPTSITVSYDYRDLDSIDVDR